MMRDIYLGITEMIIPDSIWMLAYILSLVFLFVMRKNKMRNGYRAFFLYTLFISFVIWNPFFIKFIRAHFFYGLIEYGRFSIVLMIFPVIAYVITIMYDEGKRRNERMTLLLLIILFLAFGRIDVFNQTIKAENIYKVSDEAVKIVDAIESDSNDSDIRGAYVVSGNHDLLNDFDRETRLYYSIQQYETRLSCTFACYKEEEIENDNFSLTISLGDMNNYKYIICAKNEKIIDQVEANGFIKLMSDNLVTVYKSPKGK